MSDPAFLFLRQYLRRPLGIGAVAPSGTALARAMVDALDPKNSDLVIEIGPGTGVFTRQLIKEGISPDKLILIEIDRQFAVYLRETFKGITVIEGDARQLPEILRKLGHAQVPKVLSGLPFRSIKPLHRAQITRAVGRSLEPGGSLVQFSYFNIPPLPKTTAAIAGLKVKSSGVVLRNIPPAFVWRYAKELKANGQAAA